VCVLPRVCSSRRARGSDAGAQDWTKVTNYCKRLGVVPTDFAPNYSNDFLSWAPLPETEDPTANQLAVAATQEAVKTHGGVLSGAKSVQKLEKATQVAVAA
jgi:pyrimidine precursor biosynthesis enzyme